jgi:hypothetical protein
MNLYQKYTVVILFTITCITTTNQMSLFAEDSIYYDAIYKNSIKTVQFYREGWELSYPFFRLDEGIRLVLSFDELGSTINNYSYKIIHCTKDWNESDISWSEYLEDMPVEEVIDYNYSINTSYDYIHYELKIPNENIGFKISGNYALIVYQDYDEKNVVFVRRFMVYENSVSLKVQFERPKYGEMVDKGQELELELNTGDYEIADPYSDIQINITQNYDWNTMRKITSPTFVKPGNIVYNLKDKLIFYGRDEFKHADIKSVRYVSDRVDSIEFINPYYHVFMLPDKTDPYRLYFYDIDINGKYLIKKQEADDQNLEPDYVFVHFIFGEENPDLDVHLSGYLTCWNINEDNRMEYNLLKKQYEKTLLLKQGYYNYRYVCVDDKNKYIDCRLEEGNYFETENDYYFMIYYSSPSSNYDKLIGFRIANTNRDQ